MSSIVGPVGGTISSSDDRINDPRFRDDNYVRLRGRYQFLWPCSVQISGDNTLIMDKAIGADWGKWPSKGVHARKIINGITKDTSGAPVGGCTCDLFNTIGDVVVDTVVSEPDGAFALGDPNGVACYIVAYKVNTPSDVAGTTANDLTGV